jgi:hypothetical protein
MATPLSKHSATGNKPNAVRIGLIIGLSLVSLGAAYLYAVRGNAIIFDLASGMVGMFCF